MIIVDIPDNYIQIMELNMKRITKYHPISHNYYEYLEIVSRYDVMQKIGKKSDILVVDNFLGLPEYISNSNPFLAKLGSMKCYIPRDNHSNQKNYIDNMKKIFKLDIDYINPDKPNILDGVLDSIPDTIPDNSINLLSLNLDIFPKEGIKNIIKLLITRLIDSKSVCIINFGNDMILECQNIFRWLYESGLFDTAELYSPDINESVIYGIFSGYHGSKDDKNNRKDKLDTYITNFLDSWKLKRMISITKQQMHNLPQSTIPPFHNNEQRINAILYCQKWNIPYWNKYSSKPFQDKFGQMILAETYGLMEPILYHFKTPFKLHVIPPMKISIPINQRSRSRITKKSGSISNIFKSIIKSSGKSSGKSRRRTKKLASTNMIMTIKLETELIPELEYINNRIEQTGYLIDSRRDFTKPIKNPNDKYDPQIEKWWLINKQFRYYKHKGDTEKIHLDELVRKTLRDSTISQAWLKMYEIITDCGIVPLNQSGTFHSFHICEAPGTFINALNNYIHTKTRYSHFEWNAQSLHSKYADIGDQFKLIKRHPDRWDWGATGTGDITQVENIKYYKGKTEQRRPIQLMTSDAGLAMKDEGYEKVAFASLLAILDILPVNGTMVYKILTPIDEPLILNLIYVAYCNFKELIFYKPVQNNQSREFYIVGKGYLGTKPDILTRFYDELKHFKPGSERDLFNDKYPMAFVRQFVDISTRLAENYCYTIERNIYYLDNYEKITPEFVKMLKDYYDEKNHDWLDKYKPIRLDNDPDIL